MQYDYSCQFVKPTGNQLPAAIPNTSGYGIMWIAAQFKRCRNS